MLMMRAMILFFSRYARYFATYYAAYAICSARRFDIAFHYAARRCCQRYGAPRVIARARASR